MIHTVNNRCYQTRHSTSYTSPGSVRGAALSSPLTRGRHLLRALLCNAMQCCVACNALARMPVSGRAGRGPLRRCPMGSVASRSPASAWQLRRGRGQPSLSECGHLSKSGTCVHVAPMWAEAPFPRRYPRLPHLGGSAPAVGREGVHHLEERLVELRHGVPAYLFSLGVSM